MVVLPGMESALAISRLTERLDRLEYWLRNLQESVDTLHESVADLYDMIGGDGSGLRSSERDRGPEAPHQSLGEAGLGDPEVSG